MNKTHMIIASVIAGALSTMNMWAAKSSDTRFHLNDVYMVALMTLWMMLFMGLFDYKHISVIAASLIGIIIISYMIRKQSFIDDSQYVKGMIPHHSMAITMSERIKEKSKDPVIIDMATNIIKAQSEEINRMKMMGY